MGATKQGKMAPNFSQATPDRALRFSIISAVNRRVASSNLARGAKSFLQVVLEPLFRGEILPTPGRKSLGSFCMPVKLLWVRDLFPLTFGVPIASPPRSQSHLRHEVTRESKTCDSSCFRISRVRTSARHGSPGAGSRPPTGFPSSAAIADAGSMPEQAAVRGENVRGENHQEQW